MRHLMLILQYRGTNYCGFQVQPNGVSVAQVVQDAIETVFKRRWPVKGCSRTDSGVHARAYVCSFRTASPIPCQKLPLALNSHLPPDIGVLSCEEAPPDFHARYSAKGKEYQYDIYNSPLRNPFYEETAWRFAPRLDEGKLNAWAGELLGRQDFSAFRAAGAPSSGRFCFGLLLLLFWAFLLSFRCWTYILQPALDRFLWRSLW